MLCKKLAWSTDLNKDVPKGERELRNHLLKGNVQMLVQVLIIEQFEALSDQLFYNLWLIPSWF